MTSIYIIELGFITQKTDVNIQKINCLPLVIYKIVLASFLIYNKLKKVWFFKKTFLLVNISIKMVLRMLFLTFLNINI